MTFEQFFTLVAVGAMTVIVGILAWTVREVVKLTAAVSRLEGAVMSLGERADTLDARSMSLLDMKSKVDVLDERSKHTLTAVHEIKEMLKPVPRSRAKPG